MERSFTKVATGAWNADKLEKTATFTTVEAQYVRLEATAGVNGLAAAAELNGTRDVSVPIPLAIPKNQMTATAKSFQPGSEASKAIDGDPEFRLAYEMGRFRQTAAIDHS